MGRRRKFEAFTVVGAAVPLEVARAIRQIAAKRGVSVSEIVREALMRYLEEEGMKIVIQERRRKSARAIIMQKKLAKMRREMSDLEGQVEELETYVNALRRIKSKYVYDGGALVGKEELLRRVRERLRSMQKWLTSLEKLCMMLEQAGYDVVADAEKLLQLEERIDALWNEV